MQQSPEQWHLSPLNFHPDVQAGIQISEKVELHDVTLRDGEQTPGVVLTREDRLKIARALSELGVQRIEAGFPAISSEDQEGVAALVSEGLEAEIWGFGRCLVPDVDLNAACGVQQMVLEISVSPLKMSAYGLEPAKVLGRIRSAVSHAKDLGMKVAFMPVDLTRADLGFAQDVIGLAVEEGHADELVVVDTIGVASPEAISYLTRWIGERVAVPLAVHCHNDFGLGLANSLAALKAGATCVHVSVNCLGERAGNVDLAEVAMSLKLLYGIETGIRTELLAQASRLVETCSGYATSLIKPITGERIFTRESGGVVQQLVVSPPSVEPYDPQIVGLERAVVLGKKSGRFSVQHTLQRMGLDADDAEIDRVLAEVKRISNERRGPIDDDQFREILERARTS